jgi:hypothetical protein
MYILPIISGIVSTLGLLAFYGVTLVTLNGRQGAAEEIRALWWLLVPLAIAFGTQVGMYVSLKRRTRTQGTASLAGGGASAGVSMLACCVHHATDTLPLLGMSAIGFFLIRFQKPLLILSIAINIFGIWYMHKHLKKAAA